MSDAGGFRGYIASRPILGNRTAQHVQNLVIRDYAQRHNLLFKLSATEYAMAGCYMMLQQVLQELPQLDGIIAFSMFMLPPADFDRLAFADVANAPGNWADKDPEEARIAARNRRHGICLACEKQ